MHARDRILAVQAADEFRRRTHLCDIPDEAEERGLLVRLLGVSGVQQVAHAEALLLGADDLEHGGLGDPGGREGIKQQVRRVVAAAGERPGDAGGNVFGLTITESASTNATVAFLSASGSAPKIASIAPGPRPRSFATARCVAGLAGFVVERISVIRRSARKFVKKLIQPFRWGRIRGKSRPAVRVVGKYGVGYRTRQDP